MALLAAACDSGSASPPGNGSAPSGGVGVTVAGTLQSLSASPSGPVAAGTPSPSTRAALAPPPSSGPVVAIPTSTPLAVVTGFDNYRLNSITTASLVARLKAKTALAPCGAEAAIAAALKTSAFGWAACIAADRLTAALPRASTR